MSDTPYSEQFHDIYFAVEDGLTESEYTFLEQNNLPQGWSGKSRFVIAETGFGTGLNFLCAWDLFEKTTTSGQHLHYYSVEKFPLSSAEILKYLGHWSSKFGGRLEKLIAEYPLRIGGWHTLNLTPQVTLTLMFDDVNRAIPQLNTPVDCWFLDGHAPAKNPDMWSENVFQNIGRLSRNGTRFATFTAAGIVKNGLAQVGFTIRKAKGFGTKKDMTTGIFEKETRQVFYKQKPQRIAVIGGGIAGAAMSYALSTRGCDVTIFEKNGLASGGSGNERGLCNPRISAHRGGEADFYSPAFNLAYHRFTEISKQHDIGFAASGSIHLISDDAKDKRYHSFAQNWGWHRDHARIIDQTETSDMGGVPLGHASLYMPEGSMVSPFKTTHYLAQKARVVLKNIPSLTPRQSKWIVDDEEFDCVALCGGFDVLKFKETQTLPLEKIRGQVTKVKATPLFENLKSNLCYGGYASLAEQGEAIIGSTFQKWMDDTHLRAEDDDDNLSKLREVAPHLAENLEVIGGRASFRCAANDRAPVIGQIHDAENLYISTAHGSHGILSSMMGAEFLASKICGEHQILPASTDKYLSPSRFKKKNI